MTSLKNTVPTILCKDALDLFQKKRKNKRKTFESNIFFKVGSITNVILLIYSKADKMDILSYMRDIIVVNVILFE